MELLAEMQLACLAPSSNAGWQAKQPHEAMMLLAELQQEGLAPNSITYITVISACEKGEQPH